MLTRSRAWQESRRAVSGASLDGTGPSAAFPVIAPTADATRLLAVVVLLGQEGFAQGLGEEQCRVQFESAVAHVVAE